MSPIESKLYRALIDNVPSDFVIEETDGSRAGDGNAGFHFTLERDAKIESYRVDFLLTYNDCEHRLAIECDGHDFHDRTKQQAAYDRARDRELLALGVPTIRFTGSEITHSPERCAADAFKAMRAIATAADAVDARGQSSFYAGEAYARSHPDLGENAIEEHW